MKLKKGTKADSEDITGLFFEESDKKTLFLENIKGIQTKLRDR